MCHIESTLCGNRYLVGPQRIVANILFYVESGQQIARAGICREMNSLRVNDMDVLVKGGVEVIILVLDKFRQSASLNDCFTIIQWQHIGNHEIFAAHSNALAG